MTNAVAKLTLQWKLLLVFALIVAVIAGIQIVIAGIIRSNTVQAANVTCTVTSIDPSGERIVAKLNCGESGETTIDNVKLITSYIKSPKPFVCTLYGGIGAPQCKEQGS